MVLGVELVMGLVSHTAVALLVLGCLFANRSFVGRSCAYDYLVGLACSAHLF